MKSPLPDEQVSHPEDRLATEVESRARMLVGMQESVNQQSENIDRITEAVEKLATAVANRPTRDETLRLIWISDLVKMVLLIAALAILIWSSLSNRETLHVVRDATDPKSELRQEADKAQSQVVAGLVLEMDCRNRRALVGLPSPSAGEPCKLP